MATMKIALDKQRYFREGVNISHAKINEAALEEITKGTFKRFIVVAQSIKPGTTVPRGTTVDVTLGPGLSFPGKVIDNVHPGFMEVEIGEIAERVRRNPRILEVIGKNASFKTVGADEQGALVEFAKAFHVNVDPADAQSMEALFDTAKTGFLIGGGG